MPVKKVRDHRGEGACEFAALADRKIEFVLKTID